MIPGENEIARLIKTAILSPDPAYRLNDVFLLVCHQSIIQTTVDLLSLATHITIKYETDLIYFQGKQP